ncbi:MAG TPA: flagellar basal body P-ring formation chaperone FlgA [Bryobacteraceae bacterium]|nr:flagellar basal body P-ring formation chaperone FlgA [Bryobacteraceae bacterium]
MIHCHQSRMLSCGAGSHLLIQALIILIPIRANACRAVDAAQITGKDLAAASPLFAAIDPALAIGPAPLPAVERAFRPEELLRIARQNGITISGPAPEICFERATQPLTPEKLLPILSAALDIPDATIDLVDFSRVAIPRGSLVFTRTGLEPNGLWRGRINFDENRSMPVWARVRVTTEQSWVEAAAALAPGPPVDAAQLKLVKGPRSPLGPAPLDSLEAVAGRGVSRMVKTGEPIFSNMLIAPREVERGDTVRVEVSSGSAHLSFDAVSQTSGRDGELILLKNPDNGRYFQARIAGKDQAFINK